MAAPSTNFLCLDFSGLSASHVIDWIKIRSTARDFSFLVTPNVDHIVQIADDRSGLIGAAYHAADLIVCDSRVLAHLARLSGRTLEVTPGSDLTRDLLALLPAMTSIVVIGGDARTKPTLQRLYPHLKWSLYQPPMGLRHDAEARATISRFVESSDAEIFLFCVGAPQSELTCATIKRNGRAKGVALCVGASLEFLTGDKRRAPRWMQRISLEWLFRLVTEPRRLWRRYLVVGPRIFLIWHHWCRQHRSSRP